MIKVAVVGFGWWGKHITRRLKDSMRLKVVSVVEPVAERQEEIRNLGVDVINSLEDALGRADIDAVILTTPNPFHEEQVVASAKAGKHVFCEKPLGLTAASARRSVAACVEAGVQLGIGHERRFEPAMQALARMISAGNSAPSCMPKRPSATISSKACRGVIGAPPRQFRPPPE